MAIHQEHVHEIGDEIEGCDSSPSEGIFHFVQDDNMIDTFATYLNLENLPLKSCESDNHEKFVRTTLQPDYRKVPLNTFIDSIVVAYGMKKKALRDYFLDFNGCVGITVNLWNSESGERFICVTCHWIDENWGMQIRVIGFRIIGDDATNVDICNVIINVLNVFNLREKVFCISLGNDFVHDECIRVLTNKLKPVFRELFMHDRNCGFVTNLCAQQGMEQLEVLINPINKLIRWIRVSLRDLKPVYVSMCKEVGLKPRYFPLDCATSWNSSYEMLCHIFPYREILTKLYNDNVDECFDFQWDKIDLVIKLFEKFSNANHTFSLCYEPNCHLVIQECVKIVHVLKTYENDPLLGLVVQNMRNKWLEYMFDIPEVYCIAMILDPHVKLEGLSSLLEYYYETLGDNSCVEEKISGCKDILNGLYTHYASIYKCKTITTQPIYESQMTILEKLKEMNRSSHGSESIVNVSERARAGGGGSSSELNEYLSFEHVIYEDFDILQWWQKREELFPILSKVAKDILCIPTSIAALESAFSTGVGERVLDEQWSTLWPSEMEACICKRDWDMAEKGAQRLHHRQIEDDDPCMMMDTTDSDSDSE